MGLHYVLNTLSMFCTIIEKKDYTSTYLRHRTLPRDYQKACKLTRYYPLYWF